MVFNNDVNAQSQGVQYLSTAGAWSGLDGGTAGNLLTSNGTGIAPSFQVAPQGNLVLLSTQTANNSVDIEFLSLITNTYDNYFFTFTNVLPVTATAALIMQGSTNNGGGWTSTGYSISVNYIPVGSSAFTNNNSFAGYPMTDGMSNSAGTASGQGWIMGPNIPTNLSTVVGNTAFTNNTPVVCIGFFAGCFTAFGTFNAFRFLMSTGNISTGTFSLYGLVD